MSSGSDAVLEDLNLQYKISEAVILCSILHLLYPEVVVLTVFTVGFESWFSIPQPITLPMKFRAAS
jgi:tRNA A37 methylthiotransferase MiaB